MNSDYIKNALHAGKIAKEVRSFGASLIQTGASYNNIIEKIIEKINSYPDCVPAFPPQIAINEVAAHFLPEPGTDIILNNELVSLDIGVCYKGAIGDCAISIDLSGENQKLVDASRMALLEAQKILKVGLPIRKIGEKIDEVITTHGFVSVKNLSGHGLGEYQIHTSPSIPNYDNHNEQVLEPNMTFAIEPFASNGAGLIYDAGNPYIFSFVQKRPVRSPITKAVLHTILQKNGLPFSFHELMSAGHSIGKIKLALAELMRLGIITGHAPLIDKKKGFVSQAENTIVIDENGIVHVSTE